MYGVFDNHEERVSVQTPGKTCIYQHVCALKFYTISVTLHSEQIGGHVDISTIINLGLTLETTFTAVFGSSAVALFFPKK